MRKLRKAYTAAGVTFVGGLGTFLVVADFSWKGLSAVVGTALLAGYGTYKVKNEV